MQETSDNTVYDLANTKLTVANIDATVAAQTVALATETNRAIEQEGALVDALTEEQLTRSTADLELGERIDVIDADFDIKLEDLEAKLIHIDGDEEIHDAKTFKYSGNDTLANIEIEASKTVFSKELEINGKATFNSATLLSSEIKDSASDFSVVNKKYVDSKDSAFLVTAKAYTDNLVTSTSDTLQKALEDELAIRKSADSALQTNLYKEINDRSSAIDAEGTTRKEADAVLQANIEVERTAREAAVATEAEKRQVEDTILLTRITTVEENLTAESQARAEADTTLQKALEDETTARETADNTLQSTIDAEKSAREAAISSEAEIRGAADAELTMNVQTAQDTAEKAQAAVETEISDRETAINTLTDTLTKSLQTECDARTSGDTLLQNNITAEETARQAAISSEVSDRKAVDEELQASIATVQTNLNTTNSNLTTEANLRVEGDTNLATDIKTVSDNLVVEQQTRSKADDSLSERVTTLETNLSGANSITLCGIAITKTQLQALLDLLDTMEAK